MPKTKRPRTKAKAKPSKAKAKATRARPKPKRGSASKTRKTRSSRTTTQAKQAAMIIATAATLHRAGHLHIETAADAARALEPVAGRAAGDLFAVGLLGASMLAAAVLPLATAYALGEALGFRKSVNLDFRRAGTFFGIFTALIILGAGAALLPGLPVMRWLVGVQVLNGVLLPIVLFFVIRLANDAALMADLKNTRSQNVVACSGGVSVACVAK